MDRRSFLKGLLATAALPALPSPEPTEIVEWGFKLYRPEHLIVTLEENSHLVRSAIWAKTMKEMLLDELTSMKFATVYEDAEVANDNGT